jgi:hypothetical protein
MTTPTDWSPDTYRVLAAMYDADDDALGVGRGELIALLSYRFGWDEVKAVAAIKAAEQRGAVWMGGDWS